MATAGSFGKGRRRRTCKLKGTFSPPLLLLKIFCLGEGHIIQGHLSSQLKYCTSLSQKLSQMRQLELGTLKILQKDHLLNFASQCEEQKATITLTTMFCFGASSSYKYPSIKAAAQCTVRPTL